MEARPSGKHHFTGHLSAPSPHVEQEDFAFPEAVGKVATYGRSVRWALPAGQVHERLFLSDPGCRVVFRQAATRLLGPLRRAERTTLHGTGWSVHVRFLPAATKVLTKIPPPVLLNRDFPCHESPDHEVRQAMQGPGPDGEQLQAALLGWLCSIQNHVDDSGRLVNRIVAAAGNDPEISTVAQLADRFSMSPRTLLRTVWRHTGLNPHWLLERRRLHSALVALEQEPETPLAALAIDLGFSDQAHFTRRFRHMLGFTPTELQQLYRA